MKGVWTVFESKREIQKRKDKESERVTRILKKQPKTRKDIDALYDEYYRDVYPYSGYLEIELKRDFDGGPDRKELAEIRQKIQDVLPIFRKGGKPCKQLQRTKEIRLDLFFVRNK